MQPSNPGSVSGIDRATCAAIHPRHWWQAKPRRPPRACANAAALCARPHITEKIGEDRRYVCSTSAPCFSARRPARTTQPQHMRFATTQAHERRARGCSWPARPRNKGYSKTKRKMIYYEVAKSFSSNPALTDEPHRRRGKPSTWFPWQVCNQRAGSATPTRLTWSTSV